MNRHFTAVGRRIGAVGIAAATVTGAALMAAPHAQAATTSTLTCSQASDTERYSCTVSGTSDQTTVTLPMSVSNGITVPYGTYPMASGAGTMTLAPGKVTFTFNAAYVATHEAPYTFKGGFEVKIDSDHVVGPFTVTVNGKTFVTKGPGGYCGANCSDNNVTGISKTAWDLGDGRTHFQLTLGSDKVVVGQKVTFTDTAGAGQSNCTGDVEQQRNAIWTVVGKASVDATGRVLTATYTPTQAGAVALFGSCATDGLHATYSDTGTVAGQAVNASTKVTDVYADGHGTNKPTPMVTETYQVDAAHITNSNATVNRYLAADNDRRLTYGELNSLWLNKAYRRHFSEVHQFVTIHVPANATVAQRIAAINAQTTIGDVTTTTLAGPSKVASGTFVYAWKLDTADGAKATDKLAWGPKHNLAQVFFARG